MAASTPSPSAPADSEQMFPLSELPSRSYMPLRNGKPVTLPTVYRWASKGVGGKVLATTKVGGSRCTCDAWAKDFFEAINGGASMPALGYRPETPRERRRRHEIADRKLKALGM